MGIKMGAAYDCVGKKWYADSYSKGMGKEPLHCEFCPAHVTHRKAHSREIDNEASFIPAHFKLMPNVRHAQGCKYSVVDELKIIAKESKDLLEAVREDQYRIRLVMLKEALLGKTDGVDEGSGGTGKKSGTTYAAAKGKLPAYLNTARKVLRLRALCDSDDEIAEHLELVFEGDTIVPWSKFYFETPRHPEALNDLVSGDIQYPIAIHGIVKSCRPVSGKYGPTNVLNLERPRYIPDPQNLSHGIGLQVSVWSKNASWLSFPVGREVVILGLWRAKPCSSPFVPEGDRQKFTTLTTHELSLNLSLETQIALVPDK